MLYYIALSVYVVVCFFLLIVILLQQGKGGDIAAAFGGSSSQTAFGARAGATVLTRATTVLATLFMLGALGLSVMSKGAGGSAVSGLDAPLPPPPAASTPAVTPPPTPPTTPPPTPSTTPPGKGRGGL